MADEESAQEHLDNALAATLAGNQTETAITEFEKALALGVDAEREPFTRVLLGTEYSRVAIRRKLPEAQMIRLPEWTRAETEILTGLRLDRESGAHYFAGRDGRSLLYQFDLICSNAGKARQQEKPGSGIEYIEAMLHHCDYLPSPPLLHSLFRLGLQYREAGNNQKAIESWRRLVSAAPVDYVDKDGSEAKLRRHAQENIEFVQQEQAGSSAKRSGKGCAVLIALVALPLLALAISVLW